MRIYKAIILNEPYAGWVKSRKKKIETRMRKLNLEGEIIICCDKGKSKYSPNAGKALCLVVFDKGRTMEDGDVKDACIENVPGRYAFPVLEISFFSYEFQFSDYAITKNFQGIFTIKLPDFVEILNQPKSND